MENPEKIEIEGLKTIHKLCKFGADHNMEDCTFAEIVERMFDELAKAIPDGFVLVPKEPSLKVLDRLFVEHLFDEDRAAYIYRDIIDAQEQSDV